MSAKNHLTGEESNAPPSTNVSDSDLIRAILRGSTQPAIPPRPPGPFGLSEIAVEEDQSTEEEASPNIPGLIDEPPALLPAEIPQPAASIPPRYCRPFILPPLGQEITCNASGSTYTIKHYLGEGFFSIVYQGVDEFDNDVAIKVLKPRGTYEEDHASAVGEFQRLLSLRHPKITHVHDAFEFNGSFYIVTEWCGMTLGSVISKPFIRDAVPGIARCVLQALTFIHNNGMAYLDLHLGNVFFAWGRNEFNREDLVGPTFKLGDLGVTKLESEISPVCTLANWMLPPEALDPDEFGVMDKRVDIYHAGLLLLQLVLGRALSFSRQEIVDGAPRQMALQLPEPYRSALERALRRHVEFRTPSARELYRDLQTRP